MTEDSKVEAREKEMDGVLKRFMKEFFPFTEFKGIGIFTKEMKGDYMAQSERMCKFLGYESIYEYRAKEMSCHISYGEKRPANEPFLTVIPSIYD